MAHLLPRKIKKACKSYSDSVLLKTKWLRHVHTQYQGRVDRYIHYVGDFDTYYTTKHGEVIVEYILYELEYLRLNRRNKIHR